MSKSNQKQIDAWKEQHGVIYELPVEDKTAYLREPKMNDFKRAMTALTKDGDVAFGEEMLNVLFIGGDIEVKNDDTYFLPALKQLVDFFNYDDAEITSLENRKSKITIGSESCIVRVIGREDIATAERKNPAGKPFVTQEQLFEMICLEKTAGFDDKQNAAMRFPLYQAIEKLQNLKIARLKKL